MEKPFDMSTFDTSPGIRETPVDHDLLALVCWLIRNHARYKTEIRRKIHSPNFDDAHLVYEWCNEKMYRPDLEKIQRKMRKELETNPEAFDNQQRMWFENLPQEPRDAIARAAMHKAYGTSLHKPPSPIITATR